jgi:hypothetical protein
MAILPSCPSATRRKKVELLRELFHSLSGTMPFSGPKPQLLESLCSTTVAEILTCRDGIGRVGLVWAGAIVAA